MHERHTEYTSIRRPFVPPVDLDAGRLDMGRAFAAAGFAIGALLVATLGGWLCRFVFWPGLVLFIVGLVFGLVVFYVAVSEWLAHRRRVEDWHALSLASYEQTGGVQVDHVSEYEMTAQNAAHVLLAALWVHRRLSLDAPSAPWSVRGLIGPVFIGSQRVGNITKLQAEELGKTFARLGLVAGRAPGVAGSWVPANEAELIKLVHKNWR